MEHNFKILNFSLALFATAPVPAMFGTVIVPLTSIYASLQSRKLDFNI